MPASELHAEALGSDHATPAETRDEPTADGGVEFDIVGDDGEVIMRSNRLTIDDPSRQTLSMDEIEELKKAGAGSGKEIITRIMASHMAIDEKTSFSLAKYTLRKSRKYLKRFTILPLDVGMLTEYIVDREAYKIMDLREETLGLICSWANIHCGATSRFLTAEDGISQIGGGRWLVVDDTGGLVVAALAEKMSILYLNGEDDEESVGEEENKQAGTANQTQDGAMGIDVIMKDAPSQAPAPEEARTDGNQAVKDTIEKENSPQVKGPQDLETTTEDASTNQPQDTFTKHPQEPASKPTDTTTPNQPSNPPPRSRRPPRQHIPQSTSSTNTLTVLHSNTQPNLSILNYFGHDAGNPMPTHPLYNHLKTLSWLQLLDPTSDPTYHEPEVIPDDVLATMKSSKRGNYYKKRRRWERTKRVIDETRRGGFDGLVVASVMETKTILKELVPLVRGGGRVVVYSPNVEPMIELCDYYSKERRTAFVSRQVDTQQQPQQNPQNGIKQESREESVSTKGEEVWEEDFPINPTLLLAPTLQTARARHWQVLPGRTHPFMTSKGGAEGYLFTATRVLPVEGKVEARGHFRGKKRKTGTDTAVQA